MHGATLPYSVKIGVSWSEVICRGICAPQKGGTWSGVHGGSAHSPGTL